MCSNNKILFFIKCNIWCNKTKLIKNFIWAIFQFKLIIHFFHINKTRYLLTVAFIYFFFLWSISDIDRFKHMLLSEKCRWEWRPEWTNHPTDDTLPEATLDLILEYWPPSLCYQLITENRRHDGRVFAQRFLDDQIPFFAKWVVVTQHVLTHKFT